MRFVLASASPARRETLVRAGVVAEVIVSQVDEDAIAATMPAAGTVELALKLASAKAGDVATALHGDALVLGCDSLLEFEGQTLGKPVSADVAIENWRRMRGRLGTLHTGHCLVDVRTGQVRAETVSTVVHFADVTDAEIELYCSTGEPSSVAGAFTIDGLGGWFIESVDGDHHNVVGLSLPTLRRFLHGLGYSLPDIGYPTHGP